MQTMGAIIRGVLFSTILTTLALTAGAPDYSRTGDTAFVFNLTNYSGVWDLPFPSDLGVGPDGAINVNGFAENGLLRKMVRRAKTAVEKGYGFSTSPTIYFRFNKPLHPRHIPATLTTAQPGASIFMMDVDPDSLEKGRRFPLRVKFQKERPAFDFGPENLLSVMAVPGFVLRENTTYAVVVLDTIRDENNLKLNVPAAFQALKKGETPPGAMGKKAAEIYHPVFEFLRARGVNINQIAAATVFTTGDPTMRMQKIFDAVKDMPPIPFIEPLKVTRQYEGFYVIEGAVNMPQFQPGAFPFDKEGGVIKFNSDGKPIVQRQERVPVCLSVPKGKMPSSGWPLMIYIHGTDGVSTQHVDRGVIFNATATAQPGTGPAMILAHRGIATVGAALPGWAERNNNHEVMKYYKLLNIEIMRDNILQSAVEQFVLLRIMKNAKIDKALCPETDASEAPDSKIFFDPNRVFAMGQSLGSQIAIAFGAVETDLKVLIPSGSGANMAVAIARQNPFDWKSLRKSGAGIGEKVGMDMFHPLVSLCQTALGPADPASYIRHIIKDPLPGRAPKHVWLSLGQFDHYFPPESQHAVLVGSGLDMVGSVNDGSLLEVLALAGKTPKGYPVAGNINIGAARITGVAVQYEQFGPLDGHHINFQLDETRYQYGCFLKSYIDTGVPVLYPPRKPWNSECKAE